MKSWIWNRWTGAALFGFCAAEPAFAGIGQPTPWQMNLQGAVTPVAEFIREFHDGVLWVITAICLFVLALIAIIVIRFNETKNPVPSKTTHNTWLEIAWTAIPVLILVGIAIPSFRLLKFQLDLPKPDVVIKAIGNQWYWSYEYPKEQGGGFKFDSYMLTREEAAKIGQPGLLAVDNEVVLPAGKIVQIQVVGADVIHNFAMPSFGLRMDAIPGRLNATWFTTEREGIYYGQCSRLCGSNHAFMPIAIRIVSPQAYTAWLAEAKQKFAALDEPAVKVATAATPSH